MGGREREGGSGQVGTVGKVGSGWCREGGGGRWWAVEVELRVASFEFLTGVRLGDWAGAARGRGRSGRQSVVGAVVVVVGRHAAVVVVGGEEGWRLGGLVEWWWWARGLRCAGGGCNLQGSRRDRTGALLLSACTVQRARRATVQSWAGRALSTGQGRRAGGW